jgi:Kef-type K+ transport system membrane component KefB
MPQSTESIIVKSMIELSSPFAEITAVLALAAAIGIVGLMLKQPLIVAFIATGIVAGPDALGIVESPEHVALLAHVGIAVLLFLVGLKLDLHIVRSLGSVALATGLGQVAFTSAVGFVICLALGLSTVTSAYVAVALTFSSTIIIVKLLSDKREVDSLHGRIAIGFLIVQDIAVVVAMIALSAAGVRTGSGPSGLTVGSTLGGGVLLVIATILFIRYAAEPVLARIARMPELLVTFAIAWATLFAAVCDGVGLGKELGGLLAGMSLASTSFRDAIASRLTSLRDFLLLFFFIALGAGMRVSTLGEQLPAALTLSAFVLIGNPFIVMVIMGYMGYRKRTGFLAGLTVAQISEFSLIFTAMGVTLGHIRDDSMALVTLVGLVTITLSTYMILYSHTLYRIFEPLIGWLERRTPYREINAPTSDARADILLFGLGRYGRAIGRALAPTSARLLGIDFDPEALREWRKANFDGVYGDASDPEFLETLPLADVRWAVITIPPLAPTLVHEDARVVLIKALQAARFRGRIAVRSHDAADAQRLTEAGAHVILSPFSDAANHAVERMGFDLRPKTLLSDDASDSAPTQTDQTGATANRP